MCSSQFSNQFRSDLLKQYFGGPSEVDHHNSKRSIASCLDDIHGDAIGPLDGIVELDEKYLGVKL